MTKGVSMSRHRIPILIGVLAAGLCLALAVGALAAVPKAGKTYKGWDSAPKYNGYKAAVTFKVATNGKQVRGFVWQGGGCLGLGGPGNAWADPYNNYKAATIPITRTGTFTIVNAKWTSSYHSPRKTTTFTVKGKFATPAKATGTIRYSSTDADGGGPCGETLTFTATTK